MPKFSSLFQQDSPAKAAAIALASAATLLSGCAMSNTASTGDTFAQAASISGHIHGGNQPVSNADVRLYAAGTTGYGSASTLYASTTTANDGFGSFSFTKNAALTGPTSGGSTPVYGCPTTSDPQMYIIARGGNTQGAGNGANTASAFIVAIGTCSKISAATFVDMNEITTVATMAALQQYFAPANATTTNLNQFGYPATTQAAAGFANGVATISNLANVSAGTIAGVTQTATPTGATAAVAVTVTPEAAKINTIADVLAACVNTTSSTSSACTTLFANATPPSPSVTSQPALNLGTATDTLQAAYYMLTNPTDGSVTNLKNLYALVPATAPFQPTEAVAPTDWNVGLRYSSASACSAGANFLLYAYHLAIDAAGNVYAVSNATGGNLFELSPNGTPLTCALGTTIAKSNGFAIDTTGNLWIASTTSTNLFKYTPGGTTATAVASGATTTQAGVQYVAIDGSNDIFASPYTATSTTNALYELVGGAPGVQVSTLTPSGTAAPSPYFFAADTKKRVFVSNSNGTSDLFDVYPVATADGTTLNGYDTTDFGTSTVSANVYGVQAGLNGTVAIANGNLSTSTASNTLAIITPSATAGTVTVANSAQYAGGLVGPRELAIDGAGNIWSPSSTAASGSYVTGTTNATTTYILTEFSSAGAALSPNSSPAATSTSTVNGGFQIDNSVLPIAPRGVAIDPSGNVWLGSNSATGTGITEIVGAAVPVVTPIAAGLAAGATTTNAVQKP